MQTSQGYIFCTLQHFVTKFCNFTDFNKFFTGIYFFLPKSKISLTCKLSIVRGRVLPLNGLKYKIKVNLLLVQLYLFCPTTYHCCTQFKRFPEWQALGIWLVWHDPSFPVEKKIDESYVNLFHVNLVREFLLSI